MGFWLRESQKMRYRQAGRQTATQPHGQADGEQADSKEIQQNIAARINFGYSYRGRLNR